MIRKLSFIAALVAVPAAAAPVDPFAPLQKLTGSWQGTDPDHHSSGVFTLTPDLGGKTLLRRGSNDSPQGHHEDVMIIYSSPTGLRASYWDNEGHKIDYAITSTGDHVEMLSDDVANQPRFKLVYDVRGADELAIDFSIKPPGAPQFQHYTGGTVHRKKP